jgi:hypothetical protein
MLWRFNLAQQVQLVGDMLAVEVLVVQLKVVMFRTGFMQ